LGPDAFKEFSLEAISTLFASLAVTGSWQPSAGITPTLIVVPTGTAWKNQADFRLYKIERALEEDRT
jgi:hypothetical protein